ncbi:septum formation initiator family protein [Streptomyces flavotricini]|uniref:Septum formation initiator family protein n=1 Tax=Streptomyces flavotricini TaxID=66888 RepID=A0ABS8EBD1_9ACTN|nr:septum formation initiator family protein [Streptomyces flavotricini]MCC0097822.1 septum formation initiator family protein [Streptomyces flavotricini]
MAGNRDRFSTFSTATRLKQLGERTAAHVYRSQTRRQVRRSRLTGRAALLVLVLCTLVVALAYPMRQYVSQRSEIAEQRKAAEAAGRRLERLRDEKARWQDNAYAEQQARKHLHFVRPGEISYIMTDPGAGAAERHRTGMAGSDRPWYSNVWDGVDKADRPGE